MTPQSRKLWTEDGMRRTNTYSQPASGKSTILKQTSQRVKERILKETCSSSHEDVTKLGKGVTTSSMHRRSVDALNPIWRLTLFSTCQLERLAAVYAETWRPSSRKFRDEPTANRCTKMRDSRTRLNSCIQEPQSGGRLLVDDMCCCVGFRKSNINLHVYSGG
jgi:hypothetical protein